MEEYYLFWDLGDEFPTKLSRKEILATYYDYWCSKMKSVGKEDMISEDNCIEDWVIIHWAKKEELK